MAPATHGRAVLVGDRFVALHPRAVWLGPVALLATHGQPADSRTGPLVGGRDPECHCGRRLRQPLNFRLRGCSSKVHQKAELQYALRHDSCTTDHVGDLSLSTATQTRPKRPSPRNRRSSAALTGLSRRTHRIRVGTASWTDPGFIADWYPKKLPAGDRLAWYAQRFNLVEVNSSFYAVPRSTLVARWCERTPDDFVFDIKLHRLLSRHSTQTKMLPTGLRKLAGGGDKAVLTRKLETGLGKVFLEALEPMLDAGRLGALLLQLAPSFSQRQHSLSELDHLIERLDGQKVAVELRNRNWVDEEQREKTIAYFQSQRVAMVVVDGPPGDHFMIMPSFDVVTSRRLAYLRAHGRNTRGYVSGRTVADRFDHDYSDKEVKEIADRALGLSDIAIDTHIVFNNNKSNYAPKAAERFQRIVAPQGSTARS